MAKFAKGKHALAISDRSGLAYPWRQMVTEWNGAFVHYSEYEKKQPQFVYLQGYNCIVTRKIETRYSKAHEHF